jgi:hypothetical protein
MTYYNKYVKRVNYNSREALKDRAFSRRLEKDYNRETVYKENDKESPISAIIQTSQLSARYDYKKISLPLSTNIKTGDILYWERDNTNWLIYLQRNTEKNYFLGEMREANCFISWKDKYGNKYSQLGSFSRTSPGGGGLETDYVLDYLDDGAQLLLSQNETSKKLQIYDKFIIDNYVWEVRGVDTTTYKNIILYSLKITRWNKDEDTSDLPLGQINTQTIIESNLDSFLENKLNSTILINPSTKVNGNIIEEEYLIEVDNCTLQNNNIILFDTLGTAYISITGIKTGVNKKYELNIIENPSVINTYFIKGPDLVKETLSYTYEIIRNINGEIAHSYGEWRINNALAKITESNENICKVQIGKQVGSFTLEYIPVGESSISKEIKIKNILDIL